MIKVAVIGFGFMGITHSQHISNCEQMELVAIIDKDVDAVPEKLKGAIGNLTTNDGNNDALKNIPVFSQLEECLGKLEVDAVHVCVHTDLHYTIVKKALDHGLHVLVEKPFVLDRKKGEELIELASRRVGLCRSGGAAPDSFLEWRNAPRLQDELTTSGLTAGSPWRDLRGAFPPETQDPPDCGGPLAQGRRTSDADLPAP